MEILSCIKSELFVDKKDENPTGGSIKSKQENASFKEKATRVARLIKNSFDDSGEKSKSLMEDINKIMKTTGLQNSQPENKDAIQGEED